MPTSPKTHTKTMTGTGTETIDISPQYMKNVITITGLAVGTIQTYAMEHSNTVLEEVINGDIVLETQRSVDIEGIQLKQLGFTVTPNAAYTVKVKQYDPNSER